MEGKKKENRRGRGKKKEKRKKKKEKKIPCFQTLKRRELLFYLWGRERGESEKGEGREEGEKKKKLFL